MEIYKLKNNNEFINYQYNRIVNEKMKLATAITVHDNLLSTDGNWVKSNIKWKLIKINSYELNNDNKKEEIINNIYNHITLKLLDDINFLIKRNNNLKGNKILDLINPKNKKIINKMIDHNLISFSFNKGHKPITRKTKKKSIPKLLDEFFWDIKLN